MAGLKRAAAAAADALDAEAAARIAAAAASKARTEELEAQVSGLLRAAEAASASLETEVAARESCFLGGKHGRGGETARRQHSLAAAQLGDNAGLSALCRQGRLGARRALRYAATRAGLRGGSSQPACLWGHGGVRPLCRPARIRDVAADRGEPPASASSLCVPACDRRVTGESQASHMRVTGGSQASHKQVTGESPASHRPHQLGRLAHERVGVRRHLVNLQSEALSSAKRHGRWVGYRRPGGACRPIRLCVGSVWWHDRAGAEC